MYLRRFIIDNIRSIDTLEMSFERGKEAGWHVILGANGAGKSSVIRAFALLAMGEREAYASRQDFSKWIKSEYDTASIFGAFSMDTYYDSVAGGGQPPKKLIYGAVSISTRQYASISRGADLNYTGERIDRTVWGTGLGWFSASFGPFRRFTGGDRIYDRLFVSNKRLAPHLTALGEDVALTEALSWLTSLYVQSLQDEKANSPSISLGILNSVVIFLNESGFLPHKSRIESVDNEYVVIRDGNGALVPIDQLSDGYRSAMSLVIELIRQMFEIYGYEKMNVAMNSYPGTIQAPGVVAIDEVDAHLHPTWQRDIGRWLTRVFPKVQFIITTHSPIVCRAVSNEKGEVNGSVWRLPAPGNDEVFRRIDGLDLDQLIYGDVLDAYGTELFGSGVTRSKVGTQLVERLAELNTAALQRDLTEAEKQDRRRLRAIFPAEAGRIADIDKANLPNVFS
nr:ATP-binding protein [Methylobacterium sp. Leaf122]